MSFEQLAVGQEFPPTTYELSESVISKYVEAVGGQQDLLTSGIVPPLAIGAYAMNALYFLGYLAATGYSCPDRH